MKRNHIVCAAAAAILALSAMLCSPAAADMQTYDLRIFNNSPYVSYPGLHYTVQVSDSGVNSGQARFTIRNESATGSSFIDEVYFDDGWLLGISRVESPPGVDFEQDTYSDQVKPPNLPAGNELDPPFVTSTYEDGSGYWKKKVWHAYYAKMAAEADPPTRGNVINNGQYVDIVFDLTTGHTVADVIDTMSDGTLRVGVHIQSLPHVSCASDSASAVSVIPTPAAVVLGLIGLGTLGVWRRRYC